MTNFPSYAVLTDNGFAITRPPAVGRTEMESGPAKQLKKQSRVLIPRTVTYMLNTAADYTSFKTWFETGINEGADWFNWVDPADGLTKTARIPGGKLDKEEPGNSLLTWWLVTFSIETWGG